MIVAILLVVVLFSLLVLVHEWGHFIAARRNGVEVEEFGVGFPPRIAGKRFGRTFYSINWLPLGGFVRLKGEDGTDMSVGSFAAASVWAKTKILLAGVAMNALTAYAILLILCLWGLPAAFVGQFRLPQPARTAPKQVVLVEVVQGSPAATAGLTKGDVVVKGNAEPITDEEQLHEFTKAHAGQTVELTVRHGRNEKQLRVQLNGEQAAAASGYLGVTPFATQTYSYGTMAPVVAASILGQTVWGTFSGIATTIVGALRHEANATVAVTGPVGIVVIMSNVLYLGLAYLLFFLAMVSTSLACLNIIPFPALDGGRLALIWIGKLRRKPVSPQLEAKIHTAGFVFLLFLMAVITLVDIKRMR
jgi:regulator of sigma E protease